MQEYARYKYNIQDNPPSLHFLTPSYSCYYTQKNTHARARTHTHMCTDTHSTRFSSCAKRAKESETLNIHCTDYKPDGMLLRHRTCMECVSVRVGEWVGG